MNKYIPTLDGAFYVIRSMVHISSINTLKSVHYAHFHSLIKYGIIVWGVSFNSGKIFTLQKQILIITVSAKPRTL